MSSSQNMRRWEPPTSITLRRGQREAFVLFSTVMKTRYAIQLPTGYGKTWIACMAHAVFRDLGRTNRTLIIVPQEVQFDQYVGTDDDPGLMEDLDKLQIPYLGIEWCDSTRCVKSHRQNTADIYVTTIHKVQRDKTGLFADLMVNGRWLIVADEDHHYALGQAWGEAIEALPYEVLVGMSATPFRADRRATVIPEAQDITVSIDDALREHAIRPVRANISNYFVDISTSEEEGSRRINLAQLEEEARGLDISAWEAQKKIRYNTAYLSQMLSDAVTCLQARNARHPGQHQMLVFAMSCKHAAHITETLNLIAQNPLFARWIGEGPQGQDDLINKANFAAFQKNEYPCLVQVNKAGEGFDNKRCSVGVFLNLIGDTPQARQHIGRLLRRNATIPWGEDFCDLFTSTDAKIRALLEAYSEDLPALDEMQQALLDDDASGEDTEYCRLYRIPDLFILDVEFIETQLHYPLGSLEATVEAYRDATAERLLPLGLQAPSDEQLARVLKDLFLQQQHPILASPRARKEAVQHAVYGMVPELARTALRCKYGPEIDSKRLGDVCRLINKMWQRTHQLSHDEMDEKDFRVKYAWIQEVNNTICATRELPLWLRNI